MYLRLDVNYDNLIHIDVSREFLSQAAPGTMKRNIHDDITILVLNLQNQYQ